MGLITMASNISSSVDSLENHQFLPGSEQAEENLMVVLEEGPVVMPKSMEHGLCVIMLWEDAMSDLLTWHWAHRFWHPGPGQGHSAHPHCTRSRKGPEWGQQGPVSDDLCSRLYSKEKGHGL